MPQCRSKGDGKGQPGNPGRLDAVIPHRAVLLGTSIRRLRTQPQWGESEEAVAARKANWKKALELVGDSVVLAAKDGPVQTLTRKGYDPLEVPESVVRAAEEYGCATPSKILSADELDGLESFDPTDDAGHALDWAWGQIVRAGMDDRKARPPIRCFRKVMNGGGGGSWFPPRWHRVHQRGFGERGQRRIAADGAGRTGPLPDRLQGRNPRSPRLGFQVGGAVGDWPGRLWPDDQPLLECRSPRQSRVLVSVLGGLHHGLPYPGAALPIRLPTPHVGKDAAEAGMDVGRCVSGENGTLR